jgi:methylated-DNA-[protein]-cysteine S-methyltransferase
VYEVVRRIPKGSVLTYAQVAKLAGSPNAQRAVGNALHRNADLKRVPCHRVVRSNGSLGGYLFGTKKKEQILRQEGVSMEKGKVLL